MVSPALRQREVSAASLAYVVGLDPGQAISVLRATLARSEESVSCVGVTWRISPIAALEDDAGSGPAGE